MVRKVQQGLTIVTFFAILPKVSLSVIIVASFTSTTFSYYCCSVEEALKRVDESLFGVSAVTIPLSVTLLGVEACNGVWPPSGIALSFTDTVRSLHYVKVSNTRQIFGQFCIFTI